VSAAALTSAAVWRADQLGAPVQRTWPSGFAVLDAELPGAGWPGHALTEILSPHEGTLEWRLLVPLLARLAGDGREALLVGPPQPPHPAGLHAMGLPPRCLVWLHPHSTAERLWCTEQLLRARPGGVVLAWLPDARPAQLRRLQVLAAGCETPVFVCRPDAAARETSAAPLRLRTRAMPGWAMAVDILKRRGPPLIRTLRLHAMPAGLQAVLPPRLSTPPPLPESRHVVVRPVPEPAWH
jgi:protein ImuA